MLFIVELYLITLYHKKFTRVSKAAPCIHCGKPDYCYRLGELHLCARQVEPAQGWHKTKRADDNGDYFYAPDQPQKRFSPKREIEYYYPTKNSEVFVKVSRVDDGKGNKTIWQSHWNGKEWVKGLGEVTQADIPIYRYHDTRKAIASQLPIFIVEGEKCVESMWQLRLAATTTIGGLKKWLPEHTQALEGATEIILCPDRDLVSYKKFLQISESFPGCKWLYAPPNDFFWQHLPESGGLDVADWIEDGATKEDILSAVTSERLELTLQQPPEQAEAVNEPPKKHYTQIAYEALYGDTPCISVNGKLYGWNHTHYQAVNEAEEKRRIARWCARTPIGNKYSLAQTSKVEEIYKWAVSVSAIDPGKVNPPGINCKNGTVNISWRDGNSFKVCLVPHDPKDYYIYCTAFEYQSKVDASACDALLEALEPPEREIFLRTIAASIDLHQVRKIVPEGIRALLLKGTGSNGKDSLWQATAAIFGESMTQISFSDFQEYDRGKKFNLARLENASICWASENTEFISLDSAQALKQAISGEPIVIEEKYQPAYLATPRAVFLFNCNQPPLITAGQKAIQRRWAILEFNKTFTDNPNPRLGQLQADSRFRYDPDFINREVAPALLNYLLQALERLAAEGIDYEATNPSLEKVRIEGNHLWEFVHEMGIKEDPEGTVIIGDCYQKLERWYMERGIVEIEYGRRIWSEPVSRAERWVKGANQLYARFKELFPHITKFRCTSGEYMGQFALSGITEAPTGAVGEAVLKHQTTLYQELKHSEAVGGKRVKTINLAEEFAALSKSERERVIAEIKELTAPTPPPAEVSASTVTTGDRLKRASMTIDQAKERKISFLWDKDDTCFEVLQLMFPWVKVRLPGRHEEYSFKLEQFVKAQCYGRTYYLTASTSRKAVD